MSYLQPPIFLRIQLEQSKMVHDLKLFFKYQRLEDIKIDRRLESHNFI